jgi:hypothetical protein
MTDKEAMKLAFEAFDVTIEGDAAKLLLDMVSPVLSYDEPTSIRLVVGDGHSGYGLYAACAEYQEEGAVLLVSTTPQQRKPLTESHKRKPLTHKQRLELLIKFKKHELQWDAPSVLIDMVEAAHGIKE